MQKIKGFDNLEKDPTSGAIILTPSTSKADIQVDYLVKKIAVLCEQNKQILAAIKELTEKVDRRQENHK